MSETKERRTIVKRVKNGALFSDGTIRLERVRASYPHTGTPYEGENDAGTKTSSYGCVGLMPKATHREPKDLCKAAIDALLLEHRIDKIADDRKFIKDGDRMAKPECEGMWVVSARESKRPALRGPKNDPATGKPQRLTPEEADKMFYGGCYVTMLIRPWWQNNKYGKRINANLVAIQFIEDGEAFGEGRISDDQIDDSFEGEDADDSGGWDDDNDL